MEFKVIADYFNKIESVSSRLEMTDILAELFDKIDKETAKIVVYLLRGKIAPEFEGSEIGFGEKLIAHGIAKSTGYQINDVNKEFSKTGDLGSVAEKLVNKRSQGSLFSTSLTTQKVFDNFKKMSQTQGSGSQELKKKLLAELFNSASGTEAKYIARIPLGNIRLGIGDPTIMDALAIMIAKKDNKDFEELKEEEQRKIKQELRIKIEDAYNIFSDLAEIATKLKENGIKGLDDISITPGTPIRPSAAERLPTSKEIIEKLGYCAVESKYDGFRVQLSKDNDNIRIFSRQSEEITEMFPEIIKAAKKQLPKKCIVEGEALAVNEESGEYYPFQITIQRKRKYDIEKKAKEYPLKLFLFDIMYLDGKSMMDKEFKERRKTLEIIIKKGDLIEPSEIIYTDDPKELTDFFEEKISQGLEGIIAKDLSAPYIAGARKYAWIKLKRSYKNSLDDTVDIVIIGYYTGKGKRTKFGLGALLCGAYNKKTDTIESIAKIGTGMTEEDLVNLEDLLSKIKVDKKPINVKSELEPDYWVEPKYVIEVRADEITRSPTHKVLEENGKGLALRFPRLIKIRSDKKYTDATTSNEIKKMYDIQKRVQVEEPYNRGN
jgi:DNA ligase-1